MPHPRARRGQRLIKRPRRSVNGLMKLPDNGEGQRPDETPALDGRFTARREQGVGGVKNRGTRKKDEGEREKKKDMLPTFRL